MASAVITKLHSRTATLFVFGAFLLFPAISLLHAVSVTPDHHSDQCPVCETLQHAGDLLLADPATLLAADFLPTATICCEDVFLPTNPAAHTHHTRAPPVA